MIYNDFPILNGNDYSILNHEYQSSIKDRKFFTSKLFTQIRQCFNYCNTINGVNTHIKQQLTNSKVLLNILLENLMANFSIKQPEEKEIFEFNIFTYIKKLTQILHTCTAWLAEEEKVYYKTLIKNTISTILDILKNILTSLEQSNIVLFKHM